MKKQANFQLLKVLAMLMIISHHLVTKNAVNVDTDIVGITVNKLVLQILGNNAFIGNNLFFLVSAWFLSAKSEQSVDLSYSFKSWWRIEKEVLFYSLSLCGLSYLGGAGEGSLLIQSVAPISFCMWWYATTYIVFLLIWPFYHRSLISFSIDVLRKYIAITLVLWSFSTLIPYTNYGANNFVAFLMLYAIVVYIKRSKIRFEENRKFFCEITIFPYLLGILTIVLLDLLGTKISMASQYSCYFMRGNFRPVSMAVAVGLFMWATTWKIKQSKILDVVANSTFGIYLFHMHPVVMKLLFHKIFSFEKIIYEPYATVYLVFATCVIFASGVLIDNIRKVMFACAARLKFNR